MDNSLLLYIFIAGASGGFLFGIREKRIDFPKKCDTGIYVGVIADLLFGCAGGLLIFLILPELPNLSSDWGTIKIISLALVGGYSGRALVEKVAQDRFNTRLSKLEEQERIQQNAYLMFSEIIDGKEKEIEHIKKTLNNAEPSTLRLAFAMINDRRKSLVIKLLDSDGAPLPQLKAIKSGFKSLKPLLEVIIEKEKRDYPDDTSISLHYHYASLAYVLKDQEEPNWQLALENINTAIELHKEHYPNASTPETYLLNKLLCHINLNEKDRAESCYQELWKSNGGKFELLRSESILAPKLHTWVIDNHKEDILMQIRDNDKFRDKWEKYIQ